MEVCFLEEEETERDLPLRVPHSEKSTHKKSGVDLVGSLTGCLPSTSHQACPAACSQ